MKRVLLWFAGILLAAAIAAAMAFRLSPRPPVAPAPPQATAGSLGGTVWQLVKFEGGDGTILTPDDKAKYTIAFGTDGRVSVRIDCNRGTGTWHSPGPNQLQFGPLALTLAMCPPAALTDRIARDWQYVRSYTIKDGHLFLALMVDAGIYEFEPGRRGATRRVGARSSTP